MTLTKIAGGVLGAWLVLLLGKFGAETIYHAEIHGDAAYVIEVASAEDTGDETVDDSVDFETILASADPAEGEKVFRKCTSCHKVNGENAVGPHLDGVVGREVDAVEGFAYSGALEKVADVWTPENLNGFLEKPASYAPGTIMGFAGLGKVEDRANVIAYLDSLGN
jgi:cytochrome c